MTIIQKYIAKTIIVYTLLVTLVIVGVNIFIGLVTELRDIGVGYYGFPAAIIHTLLHIPFNLYQFFPVTALIGGILGLGLLASHQELTVMRTAGLSFKKILQGVIVGSLILILIVTLIGEFISPSANLLAHKWKGSAKNGGQAVATATGIWAHEGNNFFHVEQVIGKHHLEGVSRYEFDANHHLLAAYYTKGMDYDHGNWILHDLVKTTLGSDKIVSEQIPDATWNAILSPSLLTVGMIEPEEMSMRNLLFYSSHLKQNGLQATEFEFSFWKRVFQPLATIIMIFLAIPCVINITRTASVGARIFMGTIIGISFLMLDAFLGQVSVVYQISPWISALMPILLFAVLGYIVTIKIIRY